MSASSTVTARGSRRGSHAVSETRVRGLTRYPVLVGDLIPRPAFRSHSSDHRDFQLVKVCARVRKAIEAVLGTDLEGCGNADHDVGYVLCNFRKRCHVSILD